MRAIVGHLTRNIQIGTGELDTSFKISLSPNSYN